MMHHAHNSHHPHVHPANVHHQPMHHQHHMTHPQVSINVGPHPHVQHPHHMPPPPPPQSAGMHGHRERMTHHPSRINQQQIHQGPHLPPVRHHQSGHSQIHHKQQSQQQQQQPPVLHNGPNMMGTISQQKKTHPPTSTLQQPPQNIIPIVIAPPTHSTSLSNKQKSHQQQSSPRQQLKQTNSPPQPHQHQPSQQATTQYHHPPITQGPLPLHSKPQRKPHTSPTPISKSLAGIHQLQSTPPSKRATSKANAEKLHKNVIVPEIGEDQEHTSTKGSSPPVELSREDNTAADDANSETAVPNSKEKTPMCLVNELARYNKIPHQYHLTSEQGPAHKKKFTVTLKLGTEEYTADGMSIKKAQHSAASDAISKTAYKHPPAKVVRKTSYETDVGNITPTVELNALAMKRGEATIYNVESPKSGAPLHPAPPNLLMTSNFNVPFGARSNPTNPLAQIYPSFNTNFNNRNGGRNGFPPQRFNSRDKRAINGRDNRQNLYNNYGQVTPSEEPYKVTLQVGCRKFPGIGTTLQAARHDAAAKALEMLKPLTPNETDADESSNAEDPNSDLKSPISLVYEMALKRNLTVAFEVQSEKGPPHMKTFITYCKVGNITTEGEGNRKKMSKKRAAEKMLEELKNLPPSSPIPIAPAKPVKMKRKAPVVKRKSRNLIKEKSEIEVPEEVNPISRLSQIQQARKEKEPVYTLMEERGARRRHEFVIEVTASGLSAQGVGSNKKVAKRIAAENLLDIMGITLSSNVSEKDSMEEKPSSIDKSEKEEPAVVASNEKTRKVTFKETPLVVLLTNDEEEHHTEEPVLILESTKTTTLTTSAPATAPTGGSGGRQLAPGLLLMQDTAKPESPPNIEQQQQTAAMAKELLETGSSTSGGDISKATSTVSKKHREKLQYLAALLGFEVSYSDFFKGNHEKCLSLVSLTTVPPQISHGEGDTTEESCEQAAQNALEALAKCNLDTVAPKKAEPISQPHTPVLTNGVKK